MDEETLRIGLKVAFKVGKIALKYLTDSDDIGDDDDFDFDD